MAGTRVLLGQVSGPWDFSGSDILEPIKKLVIGSISRVDPLDANNIIFET